MEDAPEWLRVGYLNGILLCLIYIEGDLRCSNDDNCPIGVKSLYWDICAHVIKDPDESYTDSWLCINVLKDEIRAMAWYHFFDVVELVGAKLKDQKGDEIFQTEPDPRYTFASYREAVNELFERTNIGYRLTQDSRLARALPKVLAQRIESTSQALEDGLGPARKHYLKAYRYIFQRPLDPENGIKEIVSSLESVGKTKFLKAVTLGDVVKELRKEGVIAPLLVSVIEKFYAFASAEPAVRHGATVDPTVKLRDAEFCFHVGVGLIRYLLDRARDA